jgi:hypothetical protein
MRGVDLPVNGAPANGIPTGRPVLPPAPNANSNGGGHLGNGVVPPASGSGAGLAEQQQLPARSPLPTRGAPDSGSGPRPVPPLGGPPARPEQPAIGLGSAASAIGPGTPFGTPTAGGPEERTPIFEQLQSEWFRQRPATPRTQSGAAPAAPPAPAAPAAAGAPPAAAAPPTPQPVPAQSPAPDEAWASPADEGWRAAERLLQPTSGGTTRAGLPMRVPQAHLMPGGADGPQAAPPEPARPAYRSPEAVRSRLASYHQGVRRGRHADRADNGDNGERDPSEVLVQQSQEQS